MNGAETFLILLLAICVVAFLARRVGMAYPIAFVLAGIALAMVPGFPAFQIPPDMILLLFLPPLLAEAAYFTSIRDFKRNLLPILQLAIGLVICTCVVTAYTLDWLIPGIGLAAGFVLGAIISPPDAVAAISVTRSVKVPQRVMSVLEGESLINDATGLVLYKFAVAAVVTGAFSLAQVSLHFLWMIVTGPLIGWFIAWVFMKLFSRIKELSVEIIGTFMVAYISYLVAEEIHSSGVLAVVAGGLTVGWFGPRTFSPTFRIPANAVWKMVAFLLNGMVFLLIGLYFPGLLMRLRGYSPGELLWLATAVSVVVMLTRLAWVFGLAYGTRFLFPSLRRTDPYPDWQNVFVVAWTGMRGVVSLATALALPLYAVGEAPFPHRDLIIFLAFSVILFTLVLQGLLLPVIVRRISLTYEGQVVYEQWLAMKESAERALDRLNELRADDSIQSAALERITSHYNDRLLSLGDGPNTPLRLSEPPTAENHPLIQTENQIWKEVLEAERRAIIGLRHAFKISDDIMHDLLRDIDLLHNRFANRS